MKIFGRVPSPGGGLFSRTKFLKKFPCGACKVGGDHLPFPGSGLWAVGQRAPLPRAWGRGPGAGRRRYPGRCAGAGALGAGALGRAARASRARARARARAWAQAHGRAYPPPPLLPTYGHNSRAGAAWQAWAWAYPTRQGRAAGGAGRWCTGGGGAGATAGHQGQAGYRGAGESGGLLTPGAREDKGLGSVTPMMVTTTGRSVCSFPRSQGRGGWGHGAGCRHSRQEARSGRVWPTSWRRTRGRRERQDNFRPKSVNMIWIWEVFGCLISPES